MADRRFYLVAYLEPDISRYLDTHDDLAAARAAARPVAVARRHLTILDLAVIGVPEALLVAALRLVMIATPPSAFRVALDRCIVRADRALIAASESVAGFRRAQRVLLAGLRRYALDLPASEAAVAPHVTLGYDCGATLQARGIDCVSWRVDEVTLIVSHHGEGRHETIEQWRLQAA